MSFPAQAAALLGVLFLFLAPQFELLYSKNKFPEESETKNRTTTKTRLQINADVSVCGQQNYRKEPVQILCL